MIGSARSRHALAFALAAAAIPLGSTMLAVAIPPIASGMAVDPAPLTTWLVTAYLVVAIAGTGPGGRLGDAIGAPRALRVGQALCGLGAVAGALAPSVAWLVACRVLMAAGGALMIPAAMSLLRAATEPSRRAHAFGAFGSVMALAAAIGPLVGGEITQALGWRATFVSQALPLALSAWLARGLPAASASSPAASSAASRPRERHVLAELARSRTFVAGATSVALHNCAMYATLFLVPILLGSVRGIAEDVVGRALLAMTLAMVAGSFLGGRVAARLGVRGSLVVAGLLTVAGLALLRDAAAIAGAADALPGLALLGLGVGLTNGPAQGSAMSAIRPERSATAAGVMSAMRYLGGVAGMAALAGVRADAAPHVAEALIAHAVTLLMAAAALAIPLALAMPRRRSPAPDLDEATVEAVG